jgi:hypothetical protein
MPMRIIMTFEKGGALKQRSINLAAAFHAIFMASSLELY